MFLSQHLWGCKAAPWFTSTTSKTEFCWPQVHRIKLGCRSCVLMFGFFFCTPELRSIWCRAFLGFTKVWPGPCIRLFGASISHSTFLAFSYSLLFLSDDNIAPRIQLVGMWRDHQISHVEGCNGYFWQSILFYWQPFGLILCKVFSCKKLCITTYCTLPILRAAKVAIISNKRGFSATLKGPAGWLTTTWEADVVNKWNPFELPPQLALVKNSGRPDIARWFI